MHLIHGPFLRDREMSEFFSDVLRFPVFVVTTRDATAVMSLCRSLFPTCDVKECHWVNLFVAGFQNFFALPRGQERQDSHKTHKWRHEWARKYIQEHQCRTCYSKYLCLSECVHRGTLLCQIKNMYSFLTHTHTDGVMLCQLQLDKWGDCDTCFLCAQNVKVSRCLYNCTCAHTLNMSWNATWDVHIYPCTPCT